MTNKYRKKPLEIDAYPVDDALYWAQHDFWKLPQWLIDGYEGKNEAGVKSVVFARNDVHITTLEGTMIANRGDYIIRGVKGELYPCRGDIFKETYESVDE